MMFTPLSAEMLTTADWIPQAIVARPTAHFAAALHIPFIHAQDDLDEYDGAALRIESEKGGFVFALKHYPGYPADTTTVYLPEGIQNVEEITHLLRIIASELKIPSKWIVWQRADNPEY